MKIKRTKNLLLWAVSLLMIMSAVSCSDTETTDSTKFALYYAGITDIGPSMSYNSGTPTYIGPAPSDFAITGVTYDGTAIDNQSFVINEITGAISISNTANLPVGTYQISISCVAGGKTYSFPNAVTVNMLPPVPKGVTVEPSTVTIDYGEVKTSTASAQVKTDGNHVSILGYNLIQETGKEYFAISKTGLITVNSAYLGDIPPGIHVISIKLTTGAGYCIFENAVTFNITSKPLTLTYSPSTGTVEAGSKFSTEAPILVGSTEGILYSIKNITPATDQISINTLTGVLSLADNNTLKVGDKYTVDVEVANKYGTKIFTDVYVFNIVAFVNPISNFSYAPVSSVQSASFEASPASGMVGDQVTYSLEDNLSGQLSIDSQTGKVSAAKGNTISIGTHNVTVKAKNIKNEVTTTLAITIKENPNYFSYIRYGNNLGLTPANNYANQFRVYSASELAALTVKPTTDIKSGADVTWSVKSLYQMSGTTIASDGTLSFTSDGWKAAAGGLVMVTATTGKGTDSEVSVTVPVFFNFASVVSGVTILYTPFVFQVNPKTGGSSVAPTVTGVDASKFALDYRRTFNYFNFNGPVTHVNGQPSVAGSFMKQVWTSYYTSVGSATVNTGSKDPMSYYSNNGTNGRTLSQALGYVDATNTWAVKINPNKFIGDDGNPANGTMIGQMTFVTDGNSGTISSSTNQIFPIFIWFDVDF